MTHILNIMYYITLKAILATWWGSSVGYFIYRHPELVSSSHLRHRAHRYCKAAYTVLATFLLDGIRSHRRSRYYLLRLVLRSCSYASNFCSQAFSNVVCFSISTFFLLSSSSSSPISCTNNMIQQQQQQKRGISWLVALTLVRVSFVLGLPT